MEADGVPVWSVIYDDDEMSGAATFLQYDTDFASAPDSWIVVRAGADVVPDGLLGYEDNTVTADVHAYAAPGVADQGSPLLGDYRLAIAGYATLDIDGNGVAEPLTDGFLAIRYLFGLRGAALITDAVSGDCTRCSAAEIEAYCGAMLP